MSLPLSTPFAFARLAGTDSRMLGGRDLGIYLAGAAAAWVSMPGNGAADAMLAGFERLRLDAFTLVLPPLGLPHEREGWRLTLERLVPGTDDAVMPPVPFLPKPAPLLPSPEDIVPPDDTALGMLLWLKGTWRLRSHPLRRLDHERAGRTLRNLFCEIAGREKGIDGRIDAALACSGLLLAAAEIVDEIHAGRNDGDGIRWTLHEVTRNGRGLGDWRVTLAASTAPH
jgi:hypothetical protein